MDACLGCRIFNKIHYGILRSISLCEICVLPASRARLDSRWLRGLACRIFNKIHYLSKPLAWRRTPVGDRLLLEEGFDLVDDVLGGDLEVLVQLIRGRRGSKGTHAHKLAFDSDVLVPAKPDSSLAGDTCLHATR